MKRLNKTYESEYEHDYFTEEWMGTMIIKANLKPCPFCGSPAKLYMDKYESSDSSHATWIHCENWHCNTRMDTTISFAGEDYQEKLDGFINRWNRRADGE